MIMLLQCDTILQWFHIHIAIILYEPENYIIMNDFTSSFIPNVNQKKSLSRPLNASQLTICNLDWHKRCCKRYW